MSEPLVIEIICPACGESAKVDGLVCRACGASLQQRAASATRSFTDSKWFIISMMVFAALFLGYPLLWRSKAFSLGEKIFWTLLVAVETVIVFAAFGWAMWRCWQVIQEAW